MKMQFLITMVSAFFPCLVFSVSPISPDISAGQNHVLALKENGEVWAWGANTEEQLGQSSGEYSPPIKVSLPLGRRGIQVAAGKKHSLILLDDGTVLSFGRNNEGQLGNGTKVKTPSLVSGLTQVTAIAAGGDHSIILKQDGSVWSFGSNHCGQLGDKTKNNQFRPVPVSEISDIIAIAASSNNSYALNRDGIVFEWGFYLDSSGTRADRTSPVQVENLKGITAISAGGTSALSNARTFPPWQKGAEAQWGNNESGPLEQTEGMISNNDPFLGLAPGGKNTKGIIFVPNSPEENAISGDNADTKSPNVPQSVRQVTITFPPKGAIL